MGNATKIKDQENSKRLKASNDWAKRKSRCPICGKLASREHDYYTHVVTHN